MPQHNDDPFPRPDPVPLSSDAESSSRSRHPNTLVPASASTSAIPANPAPEIRQERRVRRGSSSTKPREKWPIEFYSHGHGQGYDHGHGASSKQRSVNHQQPSSSSSSTSSKPRPLAQTAPHSDNGFFPPAIPNSTPSSNSVPNVDRARSHAKRSSSRQAVTGSSIEPIPIKKPRTGASPPRMTDVLTAESDASAAAKGQVTAEAPASPLFYSHSSKTKKVPKPSTFHSTDPASSILARMHQDPSGPVTTLKMPRAKVHSPGPARSGSTPGSWGSSMDTSVPSLTPDGRSLAPGLQGLSGLDVIELLDQDVRPTFLVDLGNPANASRPGLHILFYNMALRTSHSILRLLSVNQEDADAAAEFGNFKDWVMSPVRTTETHDLPLAPQDYGGITWTCSTLRRRFRVVSGAAVVEFERPDSPIPITEEPMPIATVTVQQGEDPSPELPVTPGADPIDPNDYFGEPPRKTFEDGSLTTEMDLNVAQDRSTWQHPDEFTNAVLQAQPSRATFDWTRFPVTEDLPEHIKFARTTDWSQTLIGPIEDWPYELRAIANLLMGSPHPAAMYWGPEHVVIYNAAYIDLAGQKHPSLMGSLYKEAWPEIWADIEPVFQAAWESGQATMKNDNQLFINRHGFIEETFFSWSIVPLIGSDGEVVGLYNPCFENTRRKVTERRMLTLREIGELASTATSMKGFWPQVQKGLEYNEFDVPFALIYSVKEDNNESEVSSLHSSSTHTPHIILEGSIGVPDGHATSPDAIDLRISDEAFAPYMRQCMLNNGSVVVLSEEDGTLPHDLLKGVEWKGFGDPCRTIVVFPVIPTTTGESVVGFIVMGVNPRRPYDDDYKLFIQLLSRQLATSMASVVLFEDEIKRGQRAARLAALDRQQLSMQLQQKSQEANESEYKFARMAEFAPVGMFIANSQGSITYCNDMFWQISRVPKTEDTDDAWMNNVRHEDRPALEKAWQQLLNDMITISVEFRFKCSQRDGVNTIDTWVLMSAYPEKNEHGSLKSIFGCITDISSQKWAEKVQNERREEAVELKRQQENFIDITSHEMRNPLSAILQCADQIVGNITAFSSHSVKAEVETLLEGCLDAANTINLCASHQKRIVDDILTLSKLDSNLLAVTPVDEQPVRVIQRALKMFESELVAHDIEFEFTVDKSFDQYGIKWVKLDPSRLRQVLINLMTNAIKFTQARERRNITVRVAASKKITDAVSGGVQYIDRNHNQRPYAMDIDNGQEWGYGEKINIHCSVEDTGPGLLEEELKLLFQRFQQATPRTHVQYGGSGLGLFISRILTEMQGGQIGVTSRPGLGSKFSFYIQSRISTDPPSDYEHISAFKITRKTQSPVTPTPSQPTLSRANSEVKGNPLFDVLIVEDNIVNQRVLQRQLRSCGNNTFVANHGQEALQTLQRSRYWAGQETKGMDISVILMDLEMPVMDGMTCARRIRELEKEGTIVEHIPIIAVTAYARPEQIQDAKAAGIDDVISKPFRIPELIPKIEELVSKYKNLSL